LYYTIYKITNKINGKFYIGKHKTENIDDDYMGSGKLIKLAIEKYGIENFKKEILHIFETEAEMNEAEARLVILGEDSYNLCPGGQGGWGYVNLSGKNYLHDNRAGSIKAFKENQIKLQIWRQNNPEGVILAQEKARLGVIKYFKENDAHFLGQKHSEETKQKIGKTNSIKQQGLKNSQYGTIWITNGLINKKIKVVDFIPEGWYKGRVIGSPV